MENKDKSGKKRISFVKVLRIVFPNLSVILGLMTITLVIVDSINKSMNFINNSLSIGVFVALAVSSIISTVLTLVLERENFFLKSKLRDIYKMSCEKRHHGEDEEK